MKCKILLLSLLVLCTLFVRGQEDSEWKRSAQFNFGININLNYGKGQRFPGVRAFCGLGVNAVYKECFITNYGVTLSVYTKSLGNNLNPLINDYQADLVNSFSAGYGTGNSSYVKYFRTIGPSPCYNAQTDMNYAGLLSAQFVLNNHKRNQVVGAISATFRDITLNYYNDGAPPINWFLWGISDGFDRWWTGGGGIFIHNKEEYNTVEVTFDQFTGYSPLVYELSNLLGINVPSYNLDSAYVTKDGKKIPPAYNTSTYHVRYFPMQGRAIDFGVIGALRDNAGRAYAVQDLIHLAQGFALHPNRDITRVFIGGTYNNMSNVGF